MKVKRVYSEPGYEMEFTEVYRIGKVQRWLRAVDAIDSVACDAIMCMYGDAGARWGRDAVLYQITTTGRKMVDRIRRGGGLALEMSDLEILANEENDQERHPTKRRGQQIDRMKTEAAVLKARAIKTLVKVAS